MTPRASNAPFQSIRIPAGAQLSWQVARASAGTGNNSGGLFKGNLPTGWGTDSCAKIRVNKLV